MAKLRAFFASPFAPGYRWIRNAAARAARETGVEFRAVDELAVPGEDISARIHSEIESADVAIAVVSELNPNVMYELGRALQASKPTILLADEETFAALPFDIKTFSTIRYDAAKKDEANLTPAIAAALGRMKDAISERSFRDEIVAGAHRSEAVVRAGSIVASHRVLALDFEQIRKDAESRMGKSGCKTTDIEAKDSGSFKGWHQLLSCPCGDDILVVVDLNGAIVRTRIK